MARVVIIGSGLAGLCAAIEAQELGANVIILEKREQLGGNSCKATSGMSSVESPVQIARGITDTMDNLKQDTVASAKGCCSVSLVTRLAVGAKTSLAWLEKMGVILDDVVSGGGHRNPRIHRFLPKPDGKPIPVGFSLISALKKTIEARNITVLTSACARRLRTSDGGAVDGLEYEDVKTGEVKILPADAVILTTGGFGAGRPLLQKYVPHLAHLPTTNGEWATGDGLQLATDIGAELCDMDKVQVHPTAFIDPGAPDALTKFLAPEALRGCGGILINSEGKRFANELGLRDYVSGCIFRQPKPVHLLMSEEMVNTFGRPAAEFYRSKLLMNRYDTLSDACKATGLHEDAVSETVSSYVKAASSGSSDEFGKKVFPNAESLASLGAVWTANITPALHYTMGGVAISAACEVLRRMPNGVLKPIPGLFAAGEATGGLHGANRLVGNSLLECVVFGRIAGERAATITTPEPAIHPERWTPLRFREAVPVHAADDDVPASDEGGMYVYRFDLPSARHDTHGTLGQYVAVQVPLRTPEGSVEVAERMYSPINRPDDPGVLELLIKVDAAARQGRVMRYLSTELLPGDTVAVRGPLGGMPFDILAPECTAAVLLAGGVGISPMIQIIRAVLNKRPHTTTDLHLVWGAVTKSQLVYKSMLDQKAADPANRLSVTYVLEQPPAQSQGFETGYITEDILRGRIPPPGPGVRVVICGPPIMCKVMKQILAAMGYAPQAVYSFL